MRNQLPIGKKETNWLETEFCLRIRREEKEDLKSAINFSTTNAEATRMKVVYSAGYGKKKRLVPKNLYLELSELEFREMVRLAKVSFGKTQSVKYER